MSHTGDRYRIRQSYLGETGFIDPRPKAEVTEQIAKDAILESQVLEGHGTTGVVGCISCGKGIDLGIIPYQPIGIETRIQCQECFVKANDLNKLVLDQQGAPQ